MIRNRKQKEIEGTLKKGIINSTVQYHQHQQNDRH